MNFFTRFLVRRAGWVTAAGLALSLVGGYYSVLLYKNLRTDLEELLPTDSRSVIDLTEVSARLKSIDNLAVLVFADDTQASKRFVTDLAIRLEKEPKEVIASVEYKIDKELEFFNKRKPLYMEIPDLVKVRDYIRDRIDYEKALYNPLNIFSGIELKEPELDLLGMRKKYQGKASAYSRFPDGYYATPNGKKRVVLVNMPGKASGIGGIKKLKAAVDLAIAELKPASYSPGLQIIFAGGVQNTYEEQAALVADLELSTIIVSILVAGALLVFFRVKRASFALLCALFAGTFWTFGAAWFAVGYLNANSAFLGSIVLGNGINFGIILLARYLEERRAGKDNEQAVHISVTRTTTATLTAALAAGVSYGSLTLTGFRGFRQFGVIGLIGMIFCWAATYTILPSLLTLFERWRPIVTPERKQPRPIASEFVARLIQKHAGKIWVFSLILTAGSLAMIPRINSTLIETNVAGLRNKTSMTKGSAYMSKHVDEIFQRYLSPMVLLPRHQEDVPRLVEALRAQQKAEGDSAIIRNVQSLEDFLPSHQEEKIALLKEISQLLPPKLLRRLSPDDQTLVKEFLDPAAFKTFGRHDLPPLVLSKFTEKNGSIGKMVLVEPPLRQLSGPELLKFVPDLRRQADAIAPGTPVAGNMTITSDLIAAIYRDGPRATVFAFLAVLIMVMVIFRSFRSAMLCMLALLIGMIWLMGFVLAAHFKINFLNFIALPITFGIGVDYGVNIFQRYRTEGHESLLKVIRETGGAVALCSFTTVVGYGSLIIAENQAFVSFGWLAVLGELTCLLAALFTLPAFLLYSRRRRPVAPSPSADSTAAIGT